MSSIAIVEVLAQQELLYPLRARADKFRTSDCIFLFPPVQCTTTLLHIVTGWQNKAMIVTELQKSV